MIILWWLQHSALLWEPLQPHTICDTEFSPALCRHTAIWLWCLTPSVTQSSVSSSADTQTVGTKAIWLWWVWDELAMAYPEILQVVIVWEIALYFWDKMSWKLSSCSSFGCKSWLNQLWLPWFHHLEFSKRNEPRMQVSSYTVLQVMIIWALSGQPGAQKDSECSIMVILCVCISVNMTEPGCPWTILYQYLALCCVVMQQCLQSYRSVCSSPLHSSWMTVILYGWKLIWWRINCTVCNFKTIMVPVTFTVIRKFGFFCKLILLQLHCISVALSWWDLIQLHAYMNLLCCPETVSLVSGSCSGSTVSQSQVCEMV
jgi:hypothetical protein